MTEAEQAYAAAKEKIAKAMNDGETRLSFDSEEFRALETLPPDIARIQGLRTLRLNNTAITDTGAEALARIQGLRTLALDNTAITDTAAEAIARIQGLQWLDLDNTAITDTGAEALARIQGLQTLYLDNTAIADTGTEAIARIQGLRALWLNNTAITDTGAEVLARIQGLRTLRLNNTAITDTGAEALARIQGLQTLDLDNTTITDTGAKVLSRVQGLEDLYLNDTAVHDLRPFRNHPALTGQGASLGLRFQNTAATRADPRLAEIAKIDDVAERMSALNAYLETWDPKDHPNPDLVPPDPGTFPGQSRRGLRVRRNADGQLTHDQTPPSAEDDPRVAQLHTLLRADLAELAQSCPEKHNTYGVLGTRIARYANALGDTPGDLDPLLLWNAGSKLRTYLTADESRTDFDDIPPLNADRKMALENVVTLHNTLSSNHPDLSELDTQGLDPALRHVAEENRALIDAAITALTAQVTLIVEALRTDLADMQAQSQGDDPVANRMAVFTEETVKNIVNETVTQAAITATRKTPGATMGDGAVGAAVGTVLVGGAEALSPGVAASFPGLVLQLEPIFAGLINAWHGETSTMADALRYLRARAAQAASAETKGNG